MSTLVLDSPTAGEVTARAGGTRPLARLGARWPAPGGATLADLIVGAWEGLTAGQEVCCPACSGRMRPRSGAGHAPVGGGCPSCGSHLS